MNKTEQKVVHIDDVIKDYNERAAKLIEYTVNGVLWVTEQNGEWVPHLPDNVVVFPAHRRLQ